MYWLGLVLLLLLQCEYLFGITLFEAEFISVTAQIPYGNCTEGMASSYVDIHNGFCKYGKIRGGQYVAAMSDIIFDVGRECGSNSWSLIFLHGK